MLLRSGKNLSPNLDFNTCSLQQSKFIHSGGLSVSSNFQQVSKYSFASLAKLNTLGFITIDSVDNNYVIEENNIVSVGIHSTVSGFMLSNILSQLKVKVPSLTPGISLIHHIIIDDDTDYDQNRIIIPVNYYKNGIKEKNQSYIPLYYTHKSVKILKNQINLNTTEHVEFVSFIDMQKNNKNENELFLKLIHVLTLCDRI